MEKSSSFKELLVWQMAHQLTIKVYRITEQFPKHELYGLTSQFRRAAVSIAANIAEGYVKATPKEKIQYFTHSLGSLQECRYYSILSKDLEYTIDNELETDIETISKLLYVYCKKINQKLRSF